MKIAVIIAIATMAAIGVEPLRAQAHPEADVVITNAKVWTVDSNHPAADGVAIIGDRIAAVGSAADIDAWRGSETRVIDAGGHLVLPGFNDAHVHFIEGGMLRPENFVIALRGALHGIRASGSRAATGMKRSGTHLICRAKSSLMQ
jgi:predicted amidohydrolase YtcJ